MSLRKGTYVRERDGAFHLYYNQLTSWNFPHIALNDFLSGPPYSSNQWEIVHDPLELEAVKHFAGGYLKAGEYLTVTEV